MTETIIIAAIGYICGTWGGWIAASVYYSKRLEIFIALQNKKAQDIVDGVITNKSQIGE